MSGVLKTVVKVAAIVAAVALAIPSGGTSLLAVTLGVSGIAAAGIAAGLALGSSLLSRPKTPATSQATNDRLHANIDTKTPRKFVFGRTAFATDIRDQEITGATQDEVHRFIVCASHKVAVIEELWLDDKLAWSTTGGIAAEFLGYLGVEGYADGNPANAKNISPRMGSTRRYTGLAWMYLRFKVSGNDKKAESPFAQSIPSRMTIVGKGAFIYDPRLDSTVPGGSGSMRADNQATWAWHDDASRTPALQVLWYLLGWRIQNPTTSEWKLAVGKGIPPARIDLASFITAANLCDEPVTLAAGGTQPRYRSDGLFSEGDPTTVVLDQLKASMNAELDDLDGRIRITVAHNDLATPVADFSEDDILGAFSWEQTAPLDEMFNVVRGTFIDPSTTSLYQAVDYPEVRIPSPDGIDRIQPVDFQTVQNAPQAQRLAKQRIARMLYSGRFTATFGHRAWKVQKNDVIRLTFAPLGWTNKLFRVVQTAVQVDGQVPMVLQVENAAVYLWDADERPAIDPAEPTRYDPYLNPVYQDVVDPKYGDGTPIDDLRPAEPGATDGANPAQVDLLNQLEEDTAAAILAIAAFEGTIADLLENVDDLDGEVANLITVTATQGASITDNATAISIAGTNLANLTTRVGASSPNLLKNGAFANGLTHWVANSGDVWGVAPADSAVYGRHIFLNRANQTGAEWGVSHFIYSTAAGAATIEYTLSADIRTAITSGTVRLGLQFRDGGGSVIGTTFNGPTVPATQQFDATGEARQSQKVTATAPTGTATVWAILFAQSLVGGTQVAFRNVKLEIGSVASGFTDETSVVQSFSALSALTGDYASLSSTVSVLGVDVSTFSTALSTVEGDVTTLFGRWGVEINVDGHISGIVLNNNGSRSDFIVRADRFAIANSSGIPFEVVGGVTRLADVMIGNANIDNLAVNTIKLAGNSVTDVTNIADLAGVSGSNIGIGTWATVASVSVDTILTTDRVLIFVSGRLFAGVDASGGSITNIQGRLRITRASGSVIVHPSNVYVVRNGSGLDVSGDDFLTIIEADAPGAAGTHTYALQFSASQTGGTGTVRGRYNFSVGKLFPMVIRR